VVALGKKRRGEKNLHVVFFNKINGTLLVIVGLRGCKRIGIDIHP